MAKSPLLVLGATSLIGRFALPHLATAGIVHAPVSRRPRAGWVQADLETEAGRARLPRAETVLSLSPIWLMPNALAVLRANGMRRLVAVSSTSVTAKAGSGDPRERRVVAALERGEAAVRDSGVDWTILRPTMIYAEGLDGNVSRLASLAGKLGVLPIAGRGLGLRQPVHADDLAQAAIVALAAPAAFSRTYALPGGETLTYREMAARVFRAVGREPRIVSLPPWLWRAGLAMASPLLPGATGQMGERMDRDLVFDDTAARADLGWSPRGFDPRF